MHVSRKQRWGWLRSSTATTVSFVFIVLLVLVALVGPFVLPGNPAAISRDVLQPPSPDALFGTDHLGRDQLTRMVYGARISLLVGVLAAGMAIVVGIAVGACAGFFGGIVDIALMRMSEFFQVIPTLIVAVAIVALIGPGLANIIGVIALLSWAQTARVTRAEVLRVKQLDYVNAVRCLGHREFLVLLREVIPNSLPAVMPLIALGVADAILQESSISFLGLGSPDTISWGLLLHDGQQNLLSAWWMVVIPGLAIFATVLSLNILGDAVSTALNPRLRLTGRVRRKVVTP
ncbi:peptide/nickel transport system permease protein [Jiangella sp. DSM 45060]|nr:peptide/nickel transport system permease protein [Jiangella sp. DSM 45060]